MLGDDDPEDRVAKEFEALVGEGTDVLRDVGAVDEGVTQQLVGEPPIDALGELAARASTSPRGYGLRCGHDAGEGV